MVNNFKALRMLMEKSSSAVGFLIGLGETFTRDSHDEMNAEILPTIKEILGEKVPPRVRACYGILIWFVLKVCECFHGLLYYVHAYGWTFYIDQSLF